MFVCTVECQLLPDVEAAPYVPVVGMCPNPRVKQLRFVCNMKQSNQAPTIETMHNWFTEMFMRFTLCHFHKVDEG